MAISTKKISDEDAVHYVPPRKKRPNERKAMQPPLTPMIDVTFQLLLFFLLTFTFRAAEGLIPGSLPQAGKGGEANPDMIYIRVRPHADDETGVVYEIKGENRQIYQASKLYAILAQRKKLAKSADPPVVIEPRGDVLWEHVVNAFNQTVRADYKKIGFASAS